LNGAVIGHHDPSSFVHGVLEAGFIRVANAIANCSAIEGGGYEAGVVDEQPPIDEALWGLIGLSAGDVVVDELLAKATEQFVGMMTSLGLRG
jgi:hypothetical protein